MDDKPLSTIDLFAFIAASTSDMGRAYKEAYKPRDSLKPWQLTKLGWDKVETLKSLPGRIKEIRRKYQKLAKKDREDILGDLHTIYIRAMSLDKLQVALNVLETYAKITGAMNYTPTVEVDNSVNVQIVDGKGEKLKDWTPHTSTKIKLSNTSPDPYLLGKIDN